MRIREYDDSTYYLMVINETKQITYTHLAISKNRTESLLTRQMYICEGYAYYLMFINKTDNINSS